MSDQPQGNGAPEAPQSDDSAPKYVTPEQLNSAITARFKSLEKKVEESVSGMFGGFTTKLNETLTAQFEALKPKDVTPPAKEPKGAPAVEENPAVKQLQAELAALKQQNQRIDAERKAERAAARELKMRTEVTAKLTAAGIPAPLAKKALFELVDGTKRVAYESDDSTAMMFRQDDGETVDLDSGLRSWLSSEDAKFYKPASGAAGSGDRPVGATKAPAKVSEDQTLALIAQHFGLTR